MGYGKKSDLLYTTWLFKMKYCLNFLILLIYLLNYVLYVKIYRIIGKLWIQTC